MPQSRDPWAVLKTVPGIIVDRVNVGGNESGQQSGFVGKGSLASDTQWNIDGIVITDVNSNGASSSYFDFDAFEEINVTTGGGDLEGPDGRPRDQLRDQARHERVPRLRARLPRQPQAPVEQPARGGHGPGGGQPHRPDLRLGRRAERANPQGQALVLGFLRQERHPHRPLRADEGPDAAQELERQAQLAGQQQRHALRVLVQRGEGEDRARSGRRDQLARQLPLEPGQLLSRRGLRRALRPARPLEDGVEPHLRSELQPEREVRVLRLGIRLRRRSPGRTA